MADLWFSGRERNENGQDFLRAFCRTVTEDKDRARLFVYYLRSGSVADDWWDELPAEKKTNWPTIKEEFTKRWPVIRAAQKTENECISELRAMVLSKDDLFKKEIWGGTEVYSHFVWASKMEELVRDAGLWDSRAYMGECLKNLPWAVRLVLGQVKGWEDLLRGLRYLDINELERARAGARKESAAP